MYGVFLTFKSVAAVQAHYLQEHMRGHQLQKQKCRHDLEH